MTVHCLQICSGLQMDGSWGNQIHYIWRTANVSHYHIWCGREVVFHPGTEALHQVCCTFVGSTNNKLYHAKFICFSLPPFLLFFCFAFSRKLDPKYCILYNWRGPMSKLILGQHMVLELAHAEWHETAISIFPGEWVSYTARSVREWRRATIVLGKTRMSLIRRSEWKWHDTNPWHY